MRRDELRALGRLAGQSAGGLTARIHETHRAIARRTFDVVGPAAAPVALVHDGIAAGVYGAVGAAGRLGLPAAAALASTALPTDAPALASGRGGRRALAALDAVAGDRLHADHSALALRTSLVGELGERGPRIVVFIHGLGQSETAWSRRDGTPPLGAALRDRLGLSSVYVRYNTGRPVADVGTEVAALVERMVAEWPVPVREVVFVGHALGALVAEAALATGGDWSVHATTLVALGAPYHGLAASGALRGAARALARVPETRPVAGMIEARSAGLKAAETGRPPTADQLRRLYVSGSIARDPTGWSARTFGDLVVTRDSAWAHGGGAVESEPGAYVQIGGLSHFRLPTHPAVAEQLVRWLGGGQLRSAPLALPAPEPEPEPAEPQRP